MTMKLFESVCRICFLLFVAFSFALSSTASADIFWTDGAPGGTSGCGIEFDNTGTGNGGLFLDTGILASALGDYTVSMWINADTLNGAANAGSWFFGTNNRGLHLGVRSTNGATAFSLSQGHWGADSDGSTTLSTNTWYHTTFTYDATTQLQTIYLDGTQDGQMANNAPNDTTTSMIIGARNGGNNGPQWDGKMDDVAIWDSVLTAAEVSDLADGTQSALGLGAQAYWDFEDDKFGTTAANSGSGLGGVSGNLSGITANPVPEPTSFAVLLCMGAAGLVRRRR